jgi:hypothetical protein
MDLYTKLLQYNLNKKFCTVSFNQKKICPEYKCEEMWSLEQRLGVPRTCVDALRKDTSLAVNETKFLGHPARSLHAVTIDRLEIPVTGRQISRDLCCSGILSSVDR